MKKVFIITLFIAVVFAVNLFAQTDVTLVGGLNFSTVKYNDNTVDDNVDISTKSGFVLGIEAIGDHVLLVLLLFNVEQISK